MKAGRVAAAIVAAVIAAWPRTAWTQAKLPPVVQHASDYVTAFVQKFANLVAEEVYEQETDRPARRRVLRSDFLLVKPPGQSEWFQFRDVLEIDGKPVPGHDKRMVELFVDPPANFVQRLREVTTEGSRHNLEDIGTLDRPLVALSYLQRAFVDRFAFTVGRYDNEVGPDVRLVQFREIARPAFLRTVTGDVPSHGKYWIQEDSGRVLKTELDFRSDFVETTFKYDPDLGTDVPAQMRQEWRIGRTGASMFRATATYGRFRRFSVQTDEKIR